MPQAIITTTSRSADSRPRPTSRPSSSAIGMVSAERLRQQRDHQLQDGAAGHALGDHLLGQLDDEGDNQDEGEDEQRDAANGGRISRMTYRSMMRGMRAHYQPSYPDVRIARWSEARPAVAHAPAVSTRISPPASTSCRGCGCTPSRTTGAWSRMLREFPARARHVQPGAVAGRRRSRRLPRTAPATGTSRSA